jgi:hypothetical protein
MNLVLLGHQDFDLNRFNALCVHLEGDLLDASASAAAAAAAAAVAAGGGWDKGRRGSQKFDSFGLRRRESRRIMAADLMGDSELGGGGGRRRRSGHVTPQHEALLGWIVEVGYGLDSGIMLESL